MSNTFHAYSLVDIHGASPPLSQHQPDEQSQLVPGDLTPARVPAAVSTAAPKRGKTASLSESKDEVDVSSLVRVKPRVSVSV